MTMPPLSPYHITLIAGILLSAFIWQRTRQGSQLPAIIFLGGLLGAIVGAKLAFFVLELPFYRGTDQFWIQALVGRTILGGMLGGYLGVEAAKRFIAYTAPTGDSFAVAVPLALAIGRVGCLLHGCCLGAECPPAWYATTDVAGITRYPVALPEILFHLGFALLAFMLIRARVQRGQLFHIYLMAYGLARFVTEFWRDTPRWFGTISVYQPLAIGLCVFAAWRFLQRRRAVVAASPTDSSPPPNPAAN